MKILLSVAWPRWRRKRVQSDDEQPKATEPAYVRHLRKDGRHERHGAGAAGRVPGALPRDRGARLTLRRAWRAWPERGAFLYLVCRYAA